MLSLEKKRKEFLMILIGIDLDGTLLDSEGKISRENIRALKSLENKKDYCLFICSGRPHDNIDEILKSYGLDILRVASNGAIAYKSDKKLFEYSFPKSDLKNLLETLKPYPYLAYTNSGKFVGENFIDKVEDLFERGYLGKANEEYAIYRAYTESVDLVELKNLDEELLTNDKIKIYKIFMYMPIGEIKKELEEKIDKVERVAYTESGKTNLEILPAHVNKGEVFSHLERELGLKKTTRIAIGDSLNDYEFFKNADYSFAMANSKEIIKKIATYKVASNNENGVAEAIEIIKKL
jgi:Cof subfamily protein (haloacid dehalogenase superfamily)